MEHYHIVLADSHDQFRKGIKGILEEETEMEVVGETDSGLEIINLLCRLKPEMIIIDISMPNLRGIEIIRQIKMICPEVKILILTLHKDKEYISQAFSAGADGYLVKENAGNELFTAIEKIVQGEVYVSPLNSRNLADDQ